MDARRLVGTWRLIAYEVEAEDGSVSHPLGTGAIGYLIYAEDGHMSVSLMAPDRPRFGASDIHGGTVEEKAAAAETYSAYCGTYAIVAGKVHHRIEASLLPNWTGTVQERAISLSGDDLCLSSPPMSVNGRTRVARLTWRRVRTGA